MVWVRTWGCDEVQCWLESYHLDHLKPAFAHCDGQVHLLSQSWCMQKAMLKDEQPSALGLNARVTK